MPNNIFISYSHKDKDWADLFESALKLGVTRKLYTTFTDRQIVPGDRWDREIKQQIASATIALALVTPEYLESSYVAETELPDNRAAQQKSPHPPVGADQKGGRLETRKSVSQGHSGGLVHQSATGGKRKTR